VSLVIDRFSELGNIERAGAAPEEGPKRSVANVMILEVLCRKRPSWCRRITNIDPRNTIIKVKIYRLRRGIQPLACGRGGTNSRCGGCGGFGGESEHPVALGIRCPGELAVEPVRNLIPLEFHIQHAISADAQGIALVVESGLVGVGI